jgi:hypothetical protein
MQFYLTLPNVYLDSMGVYYRSDLRAHVSIIKQAQQHKYSREQYKDQTLNLTNKKDLAGEKQHKQSIGAKPSIL